MTDDANNNCWMVAGLPAAPAVVERATPAPNAKSKADLAAGYRTAVDLCNKAFANVTTANMSEPAGGRGAPTGAPRGGGAPTPGRQSLVRGSVGV